MFFLVLTKKVGKNVLPEDEKINIALFHGAVWGSKTDVDFSIDGEVTDDFFDEFDFTLLGDIHKKQFLNDEKTMAYPGSSIQQNYGEDTGKGFLFWDIKDKDNFDVKFFEIPHLRPYITLDWDGSVDDIIDKAMDYPDGSRFRIRSKSLLYQSDSKRLQYDLKREKAATEVVFKSESTFDVSKIQTSAGTLQRNNLRDSKVHKNLIRSFYKEKDIEKEVVEKVDSLIERYVSQISDTENVLRNTRWQVNSLKFDNLFAYGQDNIINFENLPGITGIFGKKYKGKVFYNWFTNVRTFNTTDRGPIKNLHIINNRKNSCTAIVDLCINGENFQIERSTVKHETRKGEVYASTGLKLYKASQDGDLVEDITEEQRRETEKILRRMIGTADDFLMTSLASQGEMNTFIKEGATSRKMILTKFLDLGVFEKMYDTAKLESSDLRSKSKLYPDIDWDEEIDNIQFEVDESKNSLASIEKEIEQKRQTFRDLTIELAMSDTPDIVTRFEIDTQEKIISDLCSDEKEAEDKRDAFKDLISENQKMIDQINLTKFEFPIKDLRKKRDTQKNLEKSLVELRHAYNIHKTELERQETSITKLDEVPCGDKFPSCKFIKDSHADKSKIENQTTLMEKHFSLLEDTGKALDIILKEKIDKKIEKYNSIIEKESKLAIVISKLQIKLNNTTNDLNLIISERKAAQLHLSDMLPRLVEDASACKSSSVKSHILTLESDIKKLDRARLKRVEKIAGLKSEISRMKNDRKIFDNIKKDLLAYDLLMQATSKKGIPLQIMMSQLPQINLEISKILQGVTGFTVELDADSESNSMDIYINYGDSRRIIELASGMEKDDGIFSHQSCTNKYLITH